MVQTERSRGPCAFCGRRMTRGGMARHLQSCPGRRDRIEAVARTSRRSGTLLHIQAHDAYAGRHWLHLEMDGSAPLEALDQYLRAIWLECCGHLSKFSVGSPWSGRDIPMARKAGKALRPGVEARHVYDFGSSSETVVKVVAERRGKAMTDKPLTLMARNDPLEWSCMECGRAAAWLCMECIHEDGGEGTLCEEHAENHPHEDYGEPVPLVNSPRVGMCGYVGPAVPPY